MVASLVQPLGQEAASSLVDDTATWQDSRCYTLSDRIWLARQADRDAISGVLRQAVANGDDPLQAAKRLEDYLTPAGQTTQTSTPRGGTGNYAARRLARTEVSRAFNEASRRAGKAKGHSRGLPDGVYRSGQEPDLPSHPQCLCYWTPYVPDDTSSVVRGLRRDLGLPVEQRSDRWQGLPTLWRAAKALLGSEAA